MLENKCDWGILTFMSFLILHLVYIFLILVLNLDFLYFDTGARPSECYCYSDIIKKRM